MLTLAAFYTAEAAPFLAVVQVVVYTGAVLMLFVFVLMLVGVDTTDSLVETLRGQRAAAAIVGLGFAVLLVAALAGTLGSFHTQGLNGAQNDKGNVVAIAELLFSRYVFAFEATSALLITAGLGAMVLAHRERTTPKPTQRDLSRQRVAGGHPSPLPGPGVYARHNAVDFPALLPDGTPSALSVSPIIVARERELGAGPAASLPAGGDAVNGAASGGEASGAGGQTEEAAGQPEEAGSEPEEARP